MDTSVSKEDNGKDEGSHGDVGNKKSYVKLVEQTIPVPNRCRFLVLVARIVHDFIFPLFSRIFFHTCYVVFATAPVLIGNPEVPVEAK